MYTVYCDKELIHDLDSEANVLTSPTLNLELNKAPTFEFTMPPEHPFYDKIERFKSIIQVLQDGEEIFKGRAIQTQDDMYKDRTVYCEGELAYLNDTIQRPAEFHLDGLAVQRYFEKLLESHNSQVDPDGDYERYGIEAVPKYLEPGVVDIQDPNNYLYRYTNYNSTMDELKEDLVDDYGGYLRVRNVYKNNDPLGTLQHRYLDYVELGNYGKTGEQAIEFGENLLDYLGNTDQTDICTGIIPLGATLEESEFSALDTRLTIADANEGVDYLVIPEAVEKYGLILKTVVWDDVTIAENLKRNGELYLEDYKYDELVITATAVDMHLTDEEIEAWRLGDMILCRSEPHDLNDRFPLAQMQIPLDAPESTSVTLGTYQDSSLTAKTNQTASGLRNFEDFSVGNIIASAVNQATTLIDMKTNGYVTLHWDEERDCVDELLIMDTPSTDTATKVWRWNLNGLGYSSTGYSGDDAAYGTAITMNGWILGSFIIANGMILADDRDETFGKFDDTGMKIYAQSGRSDLMLMSVGREGLQVNADDGVTKLATFYSDGVKIYGDYTPDPSSEVLTDTVTLKAGEYAKTYVIEVPDGETALSITAITLSSDGYELHVDFDIENYKINTDGNIEYKLTSNVRVDIEVKVEATITVQKAPEKDYLLTQLNETGIMLFADNEIVLLRLNNKGITIYDESAEQLMTLNRRGTQFYANEDLVGTIGINTWVDTDYHGLVFDLEYSRSDAKYMSWGYQKTSGANYTVMLYYFIDDSINAQGVHFGDATYFEGNKVHFGTGDFPDAYVYGAYRTDSSGTRHPRLEINYPGTYIGTSNGYISVGESSMTLHATDDDGITLDGDVWLPAGYKFLTNRDLDLNGYSFYPNNSADSSVRYRYSYLSSDTSKHFNSLVGGVAFVDSNTIKFAYYTSDGELGCWMPLNMHYCDILNQSDVRLKTNIEESTIDALKVINSIDMKAFDLLETEEHKDIGIIANQLQVIAPELVTEDADGILSVKHSDLIYYALKAIQEISEKLGLEYDKAEYAATYSEKDKQKLVDKLIAGRAVEECVGRTPEYEEPERVEYVAPDPVELPIPKERLYQ